MAESAASKPAASDEKPTPPVRRRRKKAEDAAPPSPKSKQLELDEESDGDELNGQRLRRVTRRKKARSIDDVAAKHITSRRKAKNLEDLMAMFPIGDGEHYIRVERKSPSTWQGSPCKGQQRHLERQASLDEFVKEYGGGEYKLTAYGPPSVNASIDHETGRIKAVALSDDVSLTIAYTAPHGTPPRAAFPQLDDDDDDEWSTDDDDDDEEDDRMTRLPLPRIPRGNGLPDAKMFEAALGAQERQAARDEKLARTRQAQLQQEMAPVQHMLTQSFVESQESRSRMAEEQAREARERAAREEAHRKEIEASAALREQERLAEERRQLDAERNRLAEEQKANTPMRDMLSLVSTIMARPDNGSAQQELTRMQEAHHREVDSIRATAAQQQENLREQHKREIEALRQSFDRDRERMETANREVRGRLESSHREELRREREAAEQRLRVERESRALIEERAKKQVDEADDRVQKLARELREDCERRLSEQAKTHESALRLQKETHDHVLATEQRNHEREIRALKDSYDGRVQISEAMGRTREDTLQFTLSRVEADLVHTKAELERRGDLRQQMADLSETAQSLGYRPPGEGGDGAVDWRTQMLGMAGQVVGSLPGIIEQAAKAVKPSAPQPLPQQVQQLPPAAPAPLQLPPPGRRTAAPQPMPTNYVFGAEDGSVQVPQQNYHPQVSVMDPQHYQDSVAPVRAEPMPSQPVAPPPEQHVTSIPVARPAPRTAPPAPMPAVQTTPIQAKPPESLQNYEGNPAPSGQPQPPPQPPEIETQGMAAVDDSSILQFRPIFESAYEGGAPPDQFVNTLVQMMPGPMVKQIADNLTVDSIVAAMQRNDDSLQSSLLQDEGKAWLQQVLELAKQA